MFMTKHKTVQDLKSEISALKSVTPWSEVVEKGVYHIPPIITLERREIVILKKNGNSATYKRIGDAEQKERTMYDTSVFAKFMVKRKKY